MHQEVKYGRRQDWHLTSTGVGHHHRPGYFFPDSEFKTLLREPLPPGLAKENEVTNDKPYLTTKEQFHDKKYPGLLYKDPEHKKAPGHWKVTYMKDLTEKLGQGGWRRPLTMGNQLSEMKAEYQSKAPEVKEKYKFEEVYHPQNFLLQDHHKEGPSKVGAASTQNPKLQGQPFYVKDKGVLNILDPYLSTTQRDHRMFTQGEMGDYPKKDVPTYWQCEEYPKAWGHGLHHNPLPKDNVPRGKLPMRDETIFPTATKIPRLPKALVPVPHAGLKSLYDESFQFPSHVNMKENYYCPVDTPFKLPDPGTKSVYTAPKMYNTEYQNIGSRKPITVTK
ncbi:uncharacterized protein LOC101859880 [Aplysia californica]|uniref:Uncharacterized protein LOC101859880 n=1 Tax=Aplysia californica TaxID=6500 RepID=A0ABM0JZL3_APLCA|nr:uncharacterized protein LOC101859880 [Aplysia californica]